MAIRGIVFVVSCILLSCGSNVNTAKYRAALKKKSKLRKLFLEKFRDKGYDSTEINTRLPAFKKVVELVVDNNDNEAIGTDDELGTILLAKISAAQNDITLGCHRVRGLLFLTVILAANILQKTSLSANLFKTGWESDINFLADKTEEELKKWLMTITWDTTENKYTHQKIEIYANDDDDGMKHGVESV